MKNPVLELYMNLVFICIFLDLLYSLFDFYILYRLFYLFISLLYAGPILIAVFITEMVILHKYVIIIIIIIIIINNNDFINSCTIRQFFYYHVLYETRLRILL